MTNKQGTAWESEIREQAKKNSANADRYPKRGQKAEPDLYIGAEDLPAVPAVFWKRLVGLKSDGRRKPTRSASPAGRAQRARRAGTARS